MALYTRYLGFQMVAMSRSVKHLFSDASCRKIVSSYKKLKIVKSYRLLNQSSMICTSAVVFKRRKTAEERKSDRIIEYAPKAKGEVVDVWRDISLTELAQVLKSDIQYIYDIFLNVFDDPNTTITDMKLLQQAIRRSGRRMRIVGKPANKEEKEKVKDVFPRPPPAKSELKPRPPVVTVMGHVDHGKTTLLDALRDSRVVDQEFGGITQHIGAFLVTLPSGASVTFLDTPGHAAFTAMRARGANLTDIVVLVVAADDGVMEQTVESIKMARHANVPIMVAINKIDSPKADISRTELMLSEVGVQVESLGGDVQAIPISALKKQNLDQLTEALILQAELLDIGGDPTGPVEAVVVESKVHLQRGKVCTVVVQRGTMEKGDILVAGTTMARVRALRSADSKLLDRVPPGYPAEIEGWRDLPSAGEQVLEVDSERHAREVIKFRQDQKAEEKSELDLKAIEEKVNQHEREYKERLEMKRKLGKFRMKREGPRKPEIQKDESGIPSLNIIIKTDVDGSLEAILDVLDTYDSPNCKLDMVHYGVGPVTENDIEMAEAFNGIIYAFNVDVIPNIKKSAEDVKVPIKAHNVIYKLIDDVKEEINARLPPVEVEDILGEAEVLQQFEIDQGKKKVPIAGCRCMSGTLKRSALYKIIRNGEVIYTGHLSSMRHLKSEVDVIKADTECGLQIDDKTITFEKGDRIVCFEKKTVQQKTDWDPGF